MKSRYLISLVGLALLLSETQVSLSYLGKQTPPMLGQNGTDLSREMQLPGILLPKLLSYWQKQITFFFSKMIGVYHPVFPLLGLKDTNKTKHNFFFFLISRVLKTCSKFTPGSGARRTCVITLHAAVVLLLCVVLWLLTVPLEAGVQLSHWNPQHPAQCLAHGSANVHRN